MIQTVYFADLANGGVVYDKNGKKVKDTSGKTMLWPIPGHVHDNILGVDLRSQLMDVDNLDLLR